MTTLPKRLPKIRKIVLSILQTGIDVLYVNIPYKTKCGENYIIPEGFLEGLDRVKIIRCDDYGPITKLLPVLDIEYEPDTCIITFDDDMLVDKNVIKILLKKAKKYPDSCIGFSGICAGKFPFIYHWANSNTTDTRVDWLEGVHSILYRRKFLDKTKILNFSKEIHHLLLKNDDHWLSAYLSSKKVPMISIGYDPSYYFRETDIKYINPLCKRYIRLFWEHICIIRYFINKGVYNRQKNSIHSIGFIIIFVTSAILFFINYTYPFYFWIFLVIVFCFW